jgi:hypothetical protein
MLAFVRFPPAGGNMSDGADRREARRFTMNLPLRVLPRESQGFELDANFEIGGEIEFVITLPQQVTQAGGVDIRCRGTIVRVDSDPDGRKGIAAKIERYEFLPAAAPAA